MISLPDKKYKIIYADPAWKYASGFLKRNWSNKYNTMKAEDIYNLPVNKIADDNCILFLWVTFPKLLEGLETIKQWGFTYKTVAFYWIKTNKDKVKNYYFKGPGFWTRANPEICILATKGKPKRLSGNVDKLVVSDRREHSRKPDIIRKHIVDLLGDCDRIELFARQKFEGWDAWGNEV